MAQARTLQHGPADQTLQAVRDKFDTPIATCVVTAEAEDGANTRRVTVQVVDRLKRPWPGRWVVWVFLAATEDGDPDGTGNTVAVVTGSMQTEYLVGGSWDFIADADGVIEFDVTIVGAASRFVGTMVLGLPNVSAELEWS